MFAATATGESAFTTSSTTSLKLTLPPGRTCSLSSIRVSDNRSSISRRMRVACSDMIARKRSCASGSSFAWPLSVSMKPVSEANGVRNSWLALATKSARICSTRVAFVRSRSTISAARNVFLSVPSIGVT